MSDIKDISERRRKRCENCNELKFGVHKMINPYTEDIEGIQIWEWLCHECYGSLCMDI